MTAQIIPLPETTTDPIEQECQLLLAELEGDIAETGVGTAAYQWGMIDLLHEVARPYHGGWVDSVEACFNRRTKADYVKMFQLNGGKPAPDLLGFRDTEEALQCEAAAIEAGSSWRYLDYYRLDKQWGSDGLGSLNTVLAEYARCYRPELCPGQFPAPHKV